MIQFGNVAQKKLSFEKVPFLSGGCVSLESYRCPVFKGALHYHPEMELTFVAEGSGMALIGNEWLSFSPGHLVLIGKNIPHLYIATPAENEVIATGSVKFSSTFEEVLEIREFSPVRTMFELAQTGLIFPDTDLKDFFTGLDEKNAPVLLLRILELLLVMTGQPYRILTTQGSLPGKLYEGDQRLINEVICYLQNHISQSISLEDAARSIRMEPEAFRKFFRRHVCRNFTDYLRELRLTLACKLLRETSRSVLEVANLSGFRNISNFNRLFLLHRHMTPSAYRKL